MDTTDKIKKIIAKIAHLRELASKAGTQAEAEAAAGMAEKLIAQYEIEEADLEARGDQASEEVGEADPLRSTSTPARTRRDGVARWRPGWPMCTAVSATRATTMARPSRRSPGVLRRWRSCATCSAG